MECCPAGWSVCLPLLIFPCTIKSRNSLLAPAHQGGPGKRAVKRLWLWCSGHWSADDYSAGHLSSSSDIHVQARHCVNSICLPHGHRQYGKGWFSLYFYTHRCISVWLFCIGCCWPGLSSSNLPRLDEDRKCSPQENVLLAIQQCQCSVTLSKYW